jgi:hypothetical protein
MPLLQLASVNERQLGEDEAKLEILRSVYRGRVAVDDWRRILYQAADIIEHVGWCRGALQRETGLCATGAIVTAYSQGEARCKDEVDSDWLRIPMVREIIGKVETYLNGKQASDDEECLIGWNDSIAKNRKQVAALLRRAAAQG